MTDSILTTIKKLIGISEDCEDFDIDLIIHINTVFSILNQMGVGPKHPFFISDKTSVWSDFIETKDYLDMVRTFMYMRVRMMFDPPTGAAKEAYEQIIKETEVRMYYLEQFKEDTNES